MFCACWVKQEVGDVMQADIAALKVEMQVVKQAHAEEKGKLQKRIVAADDKLGELEKIVDEYRRAMGRNAADFGVDIERLHTQQMELRGKLEVAEHKIGIIEEKLGVGSGEQSQDMQSSSSSTSTSGPIISGNHTSAISVSKPPQDPLGAIKRPEKRDEYYKLAYRMLDSGQVDVARILFKEFLEKWPNDTYSDNALYWLAESYYVRKDYRQAAIHFQKVRQKYPKGDKAADALLKLGYCFYAMKKYREALPFFKHFVQSYPKNSLAGKAKQKIKEIERNSRKKK